MIPRPLRIFLATEAILAAAYFLLPPSTAKAAVYTALGLAAVAALVAGVRIYRPRRPQAWYLLAGGQLLFSAGDTINNTYQWVLETETPFPSVADAVYVGFFPLLVGGLLMLVRARTPGRDRTSIIDAVIIATGAGLLSWIFLIVPYVRAPDLTLSQRLFSVYYYPMVDIVLLAVAIRL